MQLFDMIWYYYELGWERREKLMKVTLFMSLPSLSFPEVTVYQVSNCPDLDYFVSYGAGFCLHKYKY